MVAPYIEHGTTPFILPPSAVLAAAEADIRRYMENHNPFACVPYQAYAFHRRDVCRVCSRLPHATGADIIREALAHLERGQLSGKHNTRVLYGMPEVLEAAIRGSVADDDSGEGEGSGTRRQQEAEVGREHQVSARPAR